MEPKGLVLLVEDNAELNANNARVLRMLGYEVHPALSLAEARAWLEKHEPDIILLDVMLPDGDGIDFCAGIRGATGAHILFLTARTEHADLVLGLANGGDDYITKPFHPEELLARVEAAMRRRRMSRIPDGAAQSGKNAEAEKLRAFAARHAFTARETDVLYPLCRGESGENIARELGIQEKTLRIYISHMLKKTGAASRAGLVALATSFQA